MSSKGRARVNAEGCNEVKDEGKETNRKTNTVRLRWLDNIDSHLKGNNTSLKEVFETKCFENRQDWRALIARSTDRSKCSGGDHCAHTWSIVSRRAGEQ